MAGVYYTMGLKNRGFISGMGQATGSLARFTGRIGLMAGAAAAAAAPLIGVASAAGILKKSLSEAASFEQTRVAFETLIGDATKARAVLEDLTAFSASTPFQFDGIAQAARLLIASGAAGDDLIGTLKAIGDVAAGSQKPIEQIAAAYAKAFNTGKVSGEVLNQLAEAGIPIWTALERATGRNRDELVEMASDGVLGLETLQGAFQSLTASGGLFNNSMQAQSRTTIGLISTLKDNVTILFRELGTPINDALKPVLEDAIGLVQRLKPQITAIGESVADALTIVINSFREGRFTELLTAGLEVGAKTFGNLLLNGVETALAFMVAGFESLKADFLGSKFVATFELLGDIIAAKIASGIFRATGRGDTADTIDEILARETPRNFQRIANMESKSPADVITAALGAATAAARRRAQSPEDLFGAGQARDNFGDIIRDLAPGGGVGGETKLPASFLAPLQEGATAVKGLEDPFANIAGAGLKALAPGGGDADGEEPRRRGVLNEVDSLDARFKRMSAADRKKNPNFSDFVQKSPFARGVLDRLERETARAAADNLPGAKAPGDDPAGKQVKETKNTNQILSEILGKLDGVAVA